MKELIFTLLGLVYIQGGGCISQDAYANFVKPNTIKICLGKKLNAEILVHELFHFFYYEKLTDKERDIVKFLYEYCDEQMCFARHYGMTNEREDFATIGELAFTIEDFENNDFSHIQNNILKVKLQYVQYLINKYK